MERERLRRCIFMLLVGCSFVLLCGCDQYTLLDQFTSSTAELSLDIEKSSLERGETTHLYPKGGKRPYSFALLEDDLAYTDTLGSISDSYLYTAGTSIGLLKIRVIDAEDTTAEVSVTIRPPSPANISITKEYLNPAMFKATVSWEYEGDLGVTFTIQRSDGGLGFVEKATGITDTLYSDLEPLAISATHKYRIIAVAEAASHTYQSNPADSVPFEYP